MVVHNPRSLEFIQLDSHPSAERGRSHTGADRFSGMRNTIDEELVGGRRPAGNRRDDGFVLRADCGREWNKRDR